MLNRVAAVLRRLRSRLALSGKSAYLSHGTDVHVGRGSRLWAPHRLVIGDHVYLGKDIHIEANCEIGDFCLIANRVAVVGRHDHDFSIPGYPMRYTPWAYSRRHAGPHAKEKAVIGTDTWLGFGVTILTGTSIGRGCVIAAGSVVAHDIPPYSIAAGVPARVIGQRFADAADIARHEAAMAQGRYRLSERGYDHCLVEPAFTVNETS